MPYDLAKAAERIRDTNYPEAKILQYMAACDPSEGGMLEKFTQAELT
jgi:hypothetical protein